MTAWRRILSRSLGGTTQASSDTVDNNIIINSTTGSGYSNYDTNAEFRIEFYCRNLGNNDYSNRHSRITLDQTALSTIARERPAARLHLKWKRWIQQNCPKMSERDERYLCAC